MNTIFSPRCTDYKSISKTMLEVDIFDKRLRAQNRLLVIFLSILTKTSTLPTRKRKLLDHHFKAKIIRPMRTKLDGSRAFYSSDPGLHKFTICYLIVPIDILVFNRY